MKFRIKDQRKFNRFIMLTIIITTLFTYTFLGIFNSSVSEGISINTESVIVRRGDTLWAIASSINTDRDVRQVLYDIMKLNDLSDSNVTPGKRIYLPSY